MTALAYSNSLPDAGIAATDWALEIMFGRRKAEAWVTPVLDTAIPSEWTGNRYATIGSEMQAKSHAGHYVCIALLKQGTSRRIDENVESVAGLVFDDVGDVEDPNTKMDIAWFQLQPEPSFVVETSERNFQFFYVFDNPVPPGEYRKLIDALKRCPETAGGIRDGTTASRYVRLPSGRNPKEGRGQFRTRLVEASGIKHGLAPLMKALGLEAGNTAGAAAAAPGTGEVLHLPEAEAIDLLTEAMALIRNNDIGREDWIGLVFAIWNASGESETAEEVAFEWTARREDGPVDAAKDLHDVWGHRRGTKAGLTTIIRWLDRQGTPEAAAMVGRLKLVQAQGVFTVVEGGDEGEAEEKPEASLDLLSELGRIGRVHSKKKIIIPGLERGFVTLVGGPSGAMKSLWVLQVAVAMVAGPAKVLELLGHDKIDFCGSVVLYPYEDAPAQILKRLDGMLRLHGLDSSKFTHRIKARTGQLLAWKNSETLVLNKTEVAALAAEKDLALIVVDTLTSALLSEETNREFQQVMVLAKGLAAKTGAAVVIVHHFRKGVGKDDETASLENMRGGSSLTAAARNVMFVEPPSKKESTTNGLGNEHMRRSHIKNTNGPLDKIRWYKREVVDIDVIDDRDGTRETETAPALVPFTPNPAATVTTAAREALAKIVTAEARTGRRVRIVDRNDGQPDIAQTVLGLDSRDTKKVLVELENLGVIRRTPGLDAGRNPILTVEVVSVASLNGDENDG